MYVICSNEGYYTGDFYIHEGEKFAIFNKNISEAKKYKSLKRTKNACNFLREKTTNCCLFGDVFIKEYSEKEY